MPTLEQERAAFALTQIESVLKDEKAKDKAKYKTLLLKLPARLHSNGLGQTVAFYLSAGPDKPEAVICGWIGEWLVRRDIYKQGDRLIDSLIGNVREMDPALVEPNYRKASAETRALAVWLKRFAEAFIPGEAKD